MQMISATKVKAEKSNIARSWTQVIQGFLLLNENTNTKHLEMYHEVIMN